MSKKPSREPERQRAEIPSEGEELVAFALRMMEVDRREAQRRGLPVITQKSFVRKLGKLRKDLERACGTLRKGSDPHIDTKDPTFIEHMRRIEGGRNEDFKKGPMRFMASLEATGERIARDPEYLKSFPRERRADQSLEDFCKDRAARMVKPWKGSVGREAAKEAGTTTKRQNARQLQSIEWHTMGMTDTEIARKHGCSVKTVERDLKGRRTRSVT